MRSPHDQQQQPDTPYPRLPYPPFKDPPDWRNHVSNRATERDVLRAEQLVEDANEDHSLKHRAHDHPWCPACQHRFNAYEDTRDGLMSVLHPKDLPEGLSDAEVRDAALDWNKMVAEIDTTCRSRVLRYLLIHSRPPKDDYDPDVQTGFADQYLDRDQLRNLPRPDPLIAGILPRHSYGILRGRDHSLKSFTAIDWGLCLATGTRWQGHHVERVPVLYVAGEGADGIEARVAAWEAHHGIEVDPDWFVTRRSALNLYRPGAAYVDLLDVVRERQFGFVVLDTMRRVSGGADGNSSEMGAVVDSIDGIKRATVDGSAMAIAHTDKPDHDSRGYSGIEDDADFVWHAKRDKTQLTLTNTKQKDGPESPDVHLQVRVVRSSLVLVAGGDGKPTATESQVKVLDALRYQTDEGATAATLLKVTGLARSTLYQAVADLKVADRIVNTGTKRSPFYEIKVSSESSDVQNPDTPSDQRESSESSGVQPVLGSPVQSSPPLGAGPGHRTQETPDEQLFEDAMASSNNVPTQTPKEYE